MLDISLNGAITASLTLISCPLITERRTCWPVSFAHWAASGAPIAAVVSEWTTSCTLCLRQTGDPMSLTTLVPCCHSPTPRRCGSVHTSSLLPWITSGRIVITRSSSVDRRPILRTLSSPTRTYLHLDTRSFIFHLKLLP